MTVVALFTLVAYVWSGSVRVHPATAAYMQHPLIATLLTRAAPRARAAPCRCDPFATLHESDPFLHQRDEPFTLASQLGILTWKLALPSVAVAVEYPDTIEADAPQDQNPRDRLRRYLRGTLSAHTEGFSPENANRRYDHPHPGHQIPDRVRSMKILHDASLYMSRPVSTMSACMIDRSHLPV
jgi:hypothetical protein